MRVVGGQCKQLSTHMYNHHVQTIHNLNLLHRLDIMVSRISIVLYPTIKNLKNWRQRRKAAEVTK